MPYDIAAMRTALQQQISPLYSDGTTGTHIRESFKRMRVSNDKLAERSASRCLIPRSDGNGNVLVACKRTTANSHAIQEKVLREIAQNNSGKLEVLDFMDINAARIANECRGPNGEMWRHKPWDVIRLPPKPVPITTASARHFACNPCDNTTFRRIEDVAIPWPSWPATTTADDLKPDPTESNFSHQLFLLAYRCLLQHISHFRGLIAADDYAINDQRIDDTYRHVLKTRHLLNREILGKLNNIKDKYDRRLTGKAKLPMVHHVVPVEPAFPIASTALTPAANSHIATTIYPARLELSNDTTKLRHWMVISAESGHSWSLQPTIKALAEAAQRTICSSQESIDWTVKRITGQGSLSTYANPDSYPVFCDQHPTAAGQIEQDIPNTIVVEYYERHIGKALCTA